MIFRILEDQFAQKSRLSKAADQRFARLPARRPLLRLGVGLAEPQQTPVGTRGVSKDVAHRGGSLERYLVMGATR